MKLFPPDLTSARIRRLMEFVDKKVSFGRRIFHVVLTLFLQMTQAHNE